MKLKRGGGGGGGGGGVQISPSLEPSPRDASVCWFTFYPYIPRDRHCENYKCPVVPKIMHDTFGSCPELEPRLCDAEVAHL